MTPDELKAARLAMGLSQAKLAKELGVDRQAVYRWEKGLHPISQTISILMTLIDFRNQVQQRRNY